MLEDDAAEAEVLLRRRRGRVESIAVFGQTFHINISSGVCQADGRAATLEHLIHEADQALHRAKQAGRDRVVRAADGVATAASVIPPSCRDAVEWRNRLRRFRSTGPCAPVMLEWSDRARSCVPAWEVTDEGGCDRRDAAVGRAPLARAGFPGRRPVRSRGKEQTCPLCCCGRTTTWRVRATPSTFAVPCRSGSARPPTAQPR